MSDSAYPRDLTGYGRTPPDPQWPDGARVAVQFVINYEEGGENAIIHGDPASEAFLSEIVGVHGRGDREQQNQGQTGSEETARSYHVRRYLWTVRLRPLPMRPASTPNSRTSAPCE